EIGVFDLRHRGNVLVIGIEADARVRTEILPCLEGEGADEGEVVARLGELRREWRNQIGKLAVVIGIGLIETGAAGNEGANAEAVHQAAGAKKAQAVLAAETDVAAVIGGIDAFVELEYVEPVEGAAVQIIVLVDAANVGADDEVVVAIEIGPDLDGVALPELRFSHAAPVIDVAARLRSQRASRREE